MIPARDVKKWANLSYTASPPVHLLRKSSPILNCILSLAPKTSLSSGDGGFTCSNNSSGVQMQEEEELWQPQSSGTYGRIGTCVSLRTQPPLRIFSFDRQSNL
ncbi:hypothetical protein PIB30_013780 [Stylosanthes scabra]|uniref:Uncharacterized protein n=1 Tax=Stylosanthes scabra TaxID=79078 RepID=A0ABU6Q6K2_9FABA|nr:hypothetical protein [Stylosanthes scabra]